jgi:hypothetical protein
LIGIKFIPKNHDRFGNKINNRIIKQKGNKMPVITNEQLPNQQLGIPTPFHDTAIIRCTKAEFGMSKASQKPMITLEWELLGVRNKEDKDKIDTTIRKNGVEYILAGLPTRPKYHTLSPEALKYYRKDWCKYTGKPETEFMVDTDKPDLSIFNKLAMSAVIKAKEVTRTKELSEEEKAAGVSNVLTDEDGNPQKYTSIEIDFFNKRFTGELPPF